MAACIKPHCVTLALTKTPCSAGQRPHQRAKTQPRPCRQRHAAQRASTLQNEDACTGVLLPSILPMSRHWCWPPRSAPVLPSHWGCQLNSGLALCESCFSHDCSAIKQPFPPRLLQARGGALLCPGNPHESHGSPSLASCTGICTKDHLRGERQGFAATERTVLSMHIATSTYIQGICQSTCCMPSLLIFFKYIYIF